VTPAGTQGARGPAIVLAVASAALLAARLYAASHVGFGDSEALYATYALHPQPAYLDHPGLIGIIARAIGGGLPLTPERAHLVTAILATIFPWFVALAARLAGATRRAAFVAGLAIAAAPEVSLGLFALTPDLPLAFVWVGGLGLAAAGLRAPAASGRAAAALLFAGTLAGIACAAKVSGVLLAGALVLAYLTPPARAHARTAWPWIGLVTGALIVSPIVAYEARRGFPLLRHRLVDTQAAAGLSLRNLGALFAGQLVYVSPVLLAVAAIVARNLFRARKGDDAVPRLLYAAFALPFVTLALLCLWSRVAEPHWLGPALLALPLFAGRPLVSRRLAVAAIATGFAFTAVAYAWVLVPASVRLLPDAADPALDIANELVGWPTAIEVVRAIVDETRVADGDDVPVVVGPHYTVCAQLHAGLERDIPVGCDDAVRDDFDDWLPRAAWQQVDSLVFVTDNRFPVDLDAHFPRRFVARSWTVPIARGGRVVRTFRVALLLPRALGEVHPEVDHAAALAQTLPQPLDRSAAGAIVRNPASRMSERSASSSGFGVVSSFSP
jgi:hypothetical protein